VEYGPDESNAGPDRDRLDRDRLERDRLDRDGPDAVRSVPAGVLVWIVAVLGVLVAIGWTVKIRGTGSDDTAGITAVPQAIAPAAGDGSPAFPSATADPTGGRPYGPSAPTATTGQAGAHTPTYLTVTVSAAWVDDVAARTGIPARALTAYADAQLNINATESACHLSWVMLAGVGSVESGHGSHGGAVLRPDGTSSMPILGPPLDGTHGNIAIHATPAGLRLDGDPRWDHAVGPMQFLPSTWTHWGVSATGGVPDPNDIDDAALTAARYLCGDHRDLATVQGWRAALGAYNAPDAYAVKVTDTAATYARASLD
jgi:membrane-bound lytic murein transglycosylase B